MGTSKTSLSLATLIHDDNNIGIDVIGFEVTSPQVAYDQVRNGVISGNTVYSNRLQQRLQTMAHS